MQFLRDLHRLLSFLRRHAGEVRRPRAVLAAAVAAGIVGGLANTALIGIANHAINRGGGARGVALAAVFAAGCIVLPAARYASSYLLLYLTEKATFGLRVTMTRRVLATPLRRLEEIGGPRVLAVLTEDIPTVVRTLAIVPPVCTHLATVAGVLVYMGMLSPTLLLGVLLFLAPALVTYQRPLLYARRHHQAQRAEMDELFRSFRGLMEGIKELQLHRERQHAFMAECVERTAGRLQRHSLAAHRIYTAARSWGQAMTLVAIGLVVFAVPAWTRADPAVLSGFLLSILYLVGPLQAISGVVPGLSRAVVAVERVERIGLQLGPPTSPPARLPGPGVGAGWASLELDGVTHSYRSERDGESFTLGPVHLALRPGELVFVTGGNGSGKTTLAKLITGLYAPESGELRLDGVPVGEGGGPGYRQLFSAVFSDFHLFDSLLGLDPAALDERARRWLARLHLDHKVRVEDGRLSTTELSQGQRKRLALLTAYLEDRPIYLFDEWAADQDPTFREVFYHQLLPGLRERGKTVIVISHDDRYYGVADRLLKLEYGRIVHDSRPAALAPARRLAAAP